MTDLRDEAEARARVSVAAHRLADARDFLAHDDPRRAKIQTALNVCGDALEDLHRVHHNEGSPA